MIKTITKAKIIKALENEPLLRRGAWFRRTGLIAKKNCAVCAVGSVLRAMSFETWSRENGIGLNTMTEKAIREPCALSIIGHFDHYTLLHLEEKNYLAALSNFFESGRTRKQCVAFVKKNFPNKLTIKINHRDVTVC